MTLPALLDGRLSIPVIGAPMFILSSPELVIAQCISGMVGSFPALNARPKEEFENWVVQIERGIEDWEREAGRKAAPFAVNQIVHSSNTRLDHDLEICAKRKVPIIITSLSKPTRVVECVHGYGGIVLHDVVNVEQAHKALEAGVDGLILVCAGAGGHTGDLSPFAFVEEVRSFYDGLVIVSGAIASGKSILAARALGADLAYIGSLFIASKEARAAETYKRMVVESAAADIVCTDAVTGVRASFLSKSFQAIGIDPKDFEGRRSGKLDLGNSGADAKAWRDVYGCGQGAGRVDEVRSAADWVAQLSAEYSAARASRAF